MNVKFDDDNFYTRYLKRFLANELNLSSNILGKFNKTDLSMLIQYLNLPNVKPIFEAASLIKEQFPSLDSLFSTYTYTETITFKARQLSKECVTYLEENLDKIKEYCSSIGWTITDIKEYLDLSKDVNQDQIINNTDIIFINEIIRNPSDYSQEQLELADLNYDGNVDSSDVSILSEYIENTSIEFTITKSQRKNYFPNQDMLVFVNQFTGAFMYNYALRDDNGADDRPHLNPNKDTKIAVFKCEPNQKLTIAHNSSQESRLVIGSMSVGRTADFVNFLCENVVDVSLKPGEYVEYITSSVEAGNGYDAEYVLIQVPSNYEQSINGGKTTITLDVGDINFDGNIDLLDYYMLAEYTAYGYGADKLPHNKANWTPTAKQLAVMNVDTDSAEINTQDAIKLYKYIKGDGSVPPLGFIYYTYNDPEVDSNANNVSNLLILQGHYDKSINIPFSEFTTNSWVVHEKFFNYLFGMAVHQYSESENITFVHKLLKELYPSYAYDRTYFYNGVYNDKIKQMVLTYQKTYTKYTTGDLNLDGRIDDVDLELLRPYIDDYADIYLLQAYIDGRVTTLTPEEYERLDVDQNGVVDKLDLQILEQRIKANYSQVFRERADINGDGIFDENDYNLLKLEVQGITHTLQKYTIPFMLGYLDVETAAKLDQDVNPNGMIKEVSS